MVAELQSEVAELRWSNAHHRAVVDSAIDYAIVATDPEGRVTHWNEGARRVLGWNREEMLGESLHRFFTEKDVANGQVEKEMREALATGHGKDERWHRRKDGEQFWASGELTVLRDNSACAIGYVKVLRDRTEQRYADEERARLEDQLRRLNEKLATDVSRRTAERNQLWEASPDLLVMLDFEGVFREVNPAWTALLGYLPDELVGQQVDSLVHPDDVLLTERALRDASTGPLPVFENRYRHKDGSYRQISWVSAPDQDLGMIYATGRDMSAAREAQLALHHAEDQLRQSQKVEAVGQLTGGVAHDFNNLLTVIRGTVDLLRRSDLTEEKRTRYIDAIADTADRAAKLTSQLLAFARRQTLKPMVFDVRNNIVNLKEMLATLTGARIAIKLEAPEEPCLVNADPGQLDTAIVNMAINARDAMNGEGRLSIAVTCVSMIPAVRAHDAVSGDFVAVSITDTGTGVPPEQIDHIFEPFYTTKGVGQGTGLGLSQVFGFTKQSGGEIAVASRAGEGTTFTLYLPRSADTGNKDVLEHTYGSAPRHDACVLIVEDNEEVGSFATEALRELGYRTHLAADARQAIEALADSGGAYDVVFSDVVMPGMSGIELGQELRRIYPHLPVVLTSGYSSVLATSGTHGFELLQKPYSIDELARALGKATARGEVAGADYVSSRHG
ncbi:hybrid sensor histidine kinase/response regulator [Sphingomonas sp. PAMC 26621]|uniref:hybrid sensor histidine kinase/response regulator n=1 Tax=Sphingomonas sp. PAMC 26621 TaxID=1112213 RepID=UPI00028873AD|nr:PAS domain-containing sensor histidine kinase [Sphingomonas sp. PAMC 26621]